MSIDLPTKGTDSGHCSIGPLNSWRLFSAHEQMKRVVKNLRNNVNIVFKTNFTKKFSKFKKLVPTLCRTVLLVSQFFCHKLFCLCFSFPSSFIKKMSFYQCRKMTNIYFHNQHRLDLCNNILRSPKFPFTKTVRRQAPSEDSLGYHSSCIFNISADCHHNSHNFLQSKFL